MLQSSFVDLPDVLASPRYRPLDAEGLGRIHRTAMKTFSEVGVQVNDRRAFDLFKAAGAEADPETMVVKVPEDMVLDLVSRAPSRVILHGRADNGSLDCELGGDQVYMGTGGTALMVQEPGRRDVRRARLGDVADQARMVEALENIHFYMINVYPHDVPSDRVDVNRFGAALNNTRKHVMGGVYTEDGVREVIKMAGMIAGSEDALRERPFISMVTCVISPFKLDEHYSRLTMACAENRIPVVVPAEPLCGATSPITLAGNLVVLTVDTLAGVMLSQLVNPGAPVLFGCVSSITDLRDMKYLSGAVEMGLLNAAAAQLAKYYELPHYTTAGMSDAKVCDAQAGYESAITGLLAALAGGNIIHDAAGFLEFCMTASYDKLVMDDEIIGMVMRAVKGIEVSDKTLAFDEIRQVGPGGHFVASRHTRRHMRNEQFSPRLSDRENRDVWRQNGAEDARTRASRKARRILSAPADPVLPEDLRRRLKTSIAGLSPEIME